MKRLIAASATLVVLLLPTVAQANIRTDATRLRARVVHELGSRAPGRDIVKSGVWTGHRSRRASDIQVRAYVSTLERMLAPRMTRSVGVSVAQYGHAASTAVPASGLAACILLRESTDGQSSSNIAQWQGSAWAEDHGPAMTGSSTPSGASYAQQVAVLNRALAEGKASQWTPYDGC